MAGFLATLAPEAFAGAPTSHSSADASACDGCPHSDSVSAHRTVLIDVGANCGDTYQTMQQMFPALQANDAEIFLWEPLPVLLEAYLRRIASSDPRVHLVEKAAWVSDGTTNFFPSRRDEGLSAAQVAAKWHCNKSAPDARMPTHPHGSATLVDGKSHWNRYRKGQPLQVATQAFAQWFAALALAPCDYVVLKIDIEGAEHAILRHLLDSSSHACAVDEWLIEWHPNQTGTPDALPALQDVIRRCSSQMRCPVNLREQHGEHWRLAKTTRL